MRKNFSSYSCQTYSGPREREKKPPKQIESKKRLYIFGRGGPGVFRISENMQGVQYLKKVEKHCVTKKTESKSALWNPPDYITVFNVQYPMS